MANLPIDGTVLRKCRLILKNGGGGVGGGGDEIEFQFPPRITSDSKSSNWREDSSASYEPTATYLGSTARSIKLSTEYIIYGEWTGEKINNAIRNLKSNIYLKNADIIKSRAPYIELEMYGYIPAAGIRSTWRIMDVSVVPSKEIVESGDNWYPLHYVMSISLTLFTLGYGKDDVGHNVIPGLPKRPEPEWY